MYYTRTYKNTNKWAIYYFCPHAGHVYLDPRFDTETEALAYIQEELRGV